MHSDRHRSGHEIPLLAGAASRRQKSTEVALIILCAGEPLTTMREFL